MPIKPAGAGQRNDEISGADSSAGQTVNEDNVSDSSVHSAGHLDLPPTVASVLKSGNRGRPLPVSTRGALEGQFSDRFNDVRVHTGAEAATAARELDAAAFTHGTDIYFGDERFRPISGIGQRILMHELTHVVQQRRSKNRPFSKHDGPVSHATDPTEREARRVTHSVEQGESPQIRQAASPAVVHRFGLGELASSIGTAVSDAANSVVETGADVVQGGVELVESGAQAVLEVGRGLVDRFAPGLLDFLQNPGARITEVLCAGVDALISGALSRFERFELIGELESSTATGMTTVQPAAEAAGGGADRLIAILEPVVGAIQQYGLPILHSVQGAIETIRETFASVWQAVAQPAADFLSEAGGAVWDGLVTLGTRIWELAEPLWRGIQGIGTRAWEWVQEQFGIAWESSEDSRNWIVERATELWESLKSAIAPVIETIQSVVETITSASSEVITAVEEAITPLWEKLTWLWENWSADDILVRAQDFLREQLLPSVLEGVSTANQALSSAVEWITDVVSGINARVQELVGAVDVDGCLQSVSRVAMFVSEQFARFAEWAQSGLGGLMNGIRSALTSVANFLRPVLKFLFKLVTVVANPLGLPALLFSEFWARIPDRLKPPIVTFLVELLITFVRGASLLASGLGPLASIVEETVVGFLVRVRDATDKVKIDASNRIAQLLGGGSLDFVGGFLWGMLKGLWEGLTDPFKLIYMLVKAGVGATRYLYNLLVGGAAEAVHRVSPGETGTGEVPTGASAGGTMAPTAEALSGVTAGSSPERPVTTATSEETVVPPSPTSATASSLQEAVATTAGVEEELLAGQERAASRENATPEGLFGLLSSVWNQVLGKAKEIGASLAEALLGYLSLPDFELGDKLGSLAGMVLFEVLLNALTAFAYSAVSATRSVLRVIVRLLDVGGEIFGGLMKLFGKIRGPVTSALGGLGRFLEKIPGLRTVWEKASNAFRSVFRYTDEAASAGRGTRRAGTETAEEAGERVAKEVMEETGERAGREAVEEAGERTAREVGGEASKRTGRRTDEAAKATEYRQAVTLARGIVRVYDEADAPFNLLLGHLMSLTNRFRWIKRFEARPKGSAERHSVYLVSSPGKYVGSHEVSSRNRPPAGLTERETQEYLTKTYSSGTWEEQVAFRGGKRIRTTGRNPRGSSLPDHYNAKLNIAVEDKNWDITWSFKRLIKEILNQQGQRIAAMPSGTKFWLTVDTRGQNISQFAELAASFRKELGGHSVYEKIILITDKGVKEF
ncbi:eCIS core domain-containing protein [Halalkalicoccus salilacus]|uniref:eCIS core domain-containing protein n=1 Tax=Halalkalicoccus salilacus TaxID=3117459 RepID=UPI00300F2CBF